MLWLLLFRRRSVELGEEFDAHFDLKIQILDRDDSKVVPGLKLKFQLKHI